MPDQSQTSSTSQWEVVEFEVTLPGTTENPFDRHPLAICKGPGGGISSSGFVLTSEDDRYLIYMPAANRRINTRLEAFYGKTMRVRWFNPLTGEYSKETQPVMEQWLRFEPPWQGQPRILILEK